MLQTTEVRTWDQSTDKVVEAQDFSSKASRSSTGTGTEHFRDWPNDLGFNYYPQTHESRQLSTSGTFPSWTAGTLLRIGPGTNETPANSEGKSFKADHWFDGFTTCHRFHIKTTGGGNCEIIYSSRGLEDAALEQARKTGCLDYVSFGRGYDPCDSLYRKVKTFFTPEPSRKLGVESVGVSFCPTNHKSDDSVISLTSDKSVLKEIDVTTLEPKSLTEQTKLSSRLFGQISAAHPCVDPETGDVYNYNLYMGPVHAYQIFHTRASDGKTSVLATFTGLTVRGSYIHSLFLTQNFVILCIWPAFFRALGIDILWKRNLLQAIEPFSRKQKCKWLVVDRTGGRGVVKKFTSPAMFCFHTVNAWEATNDDGGVDVVADLCQFEDLNILHRFYYDNLVSNGRNVNEFNKKHKTPVSLTRYRLENVPVKGTSWGSSPAKIVWSLQEPKCGDLPIINRAYYTKQHRFVYSLIARGFASFVDSIGKTDTHTGECKIWAVEKHTPGEPIFVQRPGATEEDDGVLLTVVLDGLEGTSYLLCLDAKDLTEIARATVAVPVPFGFHGIHLPESPKE